MLTRGFCQKGVYEPGQGSLVFMSSASSLCGVAGMSVYAASKAAIDGAMRSLACELAPRGIRVNTIVAGAIKTEMHEGLEKNINEKELAEYEQKHLLGFGSPRGYSLCGSFSLIRGRQMDNRHQHGGGWGLLLSLTQMILLGG